METLLILLALLLLCAFVRNKAKFFRKLNIPEPSGAWPLIGHLHLLSGQDPVCKTLGALADRYGPIYSLKLGFHRLLVVSSWEIAKECLTINDRVFATRPSIAAGRIIGYNSAVFALAPYGEYWRNIRKIATLELLSSHRLEKLKHIRFSEIEMLLKDLHTVCTKSVDNQGKVTMSHLLETFTFNINLRMIVGKRFSRSSYGDESSDAWRYKRAITEATHLCGVFVLSDAIPWLEWMDFQGYVRSMKKTAAELDSVISAWLDEHVQRKLKNVNKSEGDFVDVMLSVLPEDVVLTGHTRDIIVKATTLILTLTGAESIALTLTWAISLLVNHPSTLKAAQEEIDTYVGREKWVEESDIKSLSYLQAIVKEALRLYPPGPITGLREAMEDCSIAGYHVPKGTRLVVNLWKLHRDPRVWEHPNEFRPERFMNTHAQIDVKGQNFELIPFSSGRRSCPGMTFGLQVVHLTLARLIQGFDMGTVGGVPVDMREDLGLALPKVTPLEVVLKPRLPLELYQ